MLCFIKRSCWFLLWREKTGDWREWKETDFNMNFSCLRSETNVTLWPLKSEDFLPFCLCLSDCVVRVRRLVVMHCSQHPCPYPPSCKSKNSSFFTLHDSLILQNHDSCMKTKDSWVSPEKPFNNCFVIQPTIYRVGSIICFSYWLQVSTCWFSEGKLWRILE